MLASDASGIIDEVGLLQRLDALDRRFGFGAHPSHNWRVRRPPFAVMLGALLYLFEAIGLIQQAIGHRTGISILAFLPLILIAWIVATVVIQSPRRWARWVVIASELPVVVRVVVRAADDPSRLIGLAYVGLIVGLLTIPPSSRAFYAGEWSARA